MARRLGLRLQAGGVVAAALGGARAAGSRARVILRDPHRHRGCIGLEIGPDRRGDDDEQVVRRGLHAEEDLVGEHERPDVEAAVAVRDPGAVDLHELVDSLEEHVLRQDRHGEALGRLLEAAGILQRAEQRRAAVGGAVGLQPLEDLLRVVQDRRGRIHRDRRARLDLGVIPALGLMIADGDHVVGEDPAEARILEQFRALLGGDRRRMRNAGELKRGHCLGHFSLEYFSHSITGGRAASPGASLIAEFAQSRAGRRTARRRGSRRRHGCGPRRGRC